MISKRKIGIIGAGYSGSMLAVRLAQIKNSSCEILVFEKGRDFARGVAYQDVNDHHLLNVPAIKMGAFVSDPEDFYKWLVKSEVLWKSKFPSLNVGPQAFVPRRLYGTYLQSLFNSFNITRICHEVTDVGEVSSAGIEVFADKSYRLDKLILATGNSDSIPHEIFEFEEKLGSQFIRDPLDSKKLELVGRNSVIGIIGSGLTMIDTVLGLKNRNHKGNIFILSRHGLLPTPHKFSENQNQALNKPQVMTVRSWLQSLRLQADHATKQGQPWQSVMDIMQPQVQQIWQEFTDIEKKRFLRHARPFWEIHRHRVFSEHLNMIHDLQEQGQLCRVAGRVENAELNGESIDFKYRRRGQNKSELIKLHCLINCTGSGNGLDSSESRLLKSLVSKNLVQADNLGMGVNVGPLGKISENMYALGALCKGSLWEITSVPSIRQQIESLSLIL